MGMKR